MLTSLHVGEGFLDSACLNSDTSFQRVFNNFLHIATLDIDHAVP